MIASYSELANKLAKATAELKAGDKKAEKRVRQLSSQLRQIERETPFASSPNLGNHSN
jgi:hypothetical protein